MSSEAPDQGSGQHAWVRWRQIGLVAVAVLIVATILYMARGALFPFIISIVLAELLYGEPALDPRHGTGWGRGAGAPGASSG